MNDNSRNGEQGNNRTADILIGLSIGLMAGVAGALLLAPASGRNTRRKIGELAGDVADRTGALADLAGATLKDQAGRVGQAIVAGKEAFRQAQDKVAG
jgi:gas vesicle protein